MSTFAFRCRQTGQLIDSGIQADAAGMPQIPVTGFRLRCPFCEERHVWRITEGQLVEPAPTSLLRDGKGIIERFRSLQARLAAA